MPPDVLALSRGTSAPGDFVEDDELEMHDGGGAASGGPSRAPHPFAADFRILSIVFESVDDEDDDAAPGPSSTLLWAPCTSPAIECPFVMQLTHYKASIGIDARPGTSIRTMFAVSVLQRDWAVW